uniref:Ral transcription factor IIIC subunit 4 n=1 Tax=Aotus nancymaae TaxID=37293 RepID=A0A2K5CJX6_AOTNA
MDTADQTLVGPADDGPAPPEEEEEEEGGGETGSEAGGKEPAADAAPGPSAAFRLMVTRREPAVKLQYAVSGLEPLAWSEDHRVSVSTARSIAVLELICDVHNPGQDLVIHRTSVPAPLNSCLLKVGSKTEVAECKEKFAASKDPTAFTHCLLSP